MDVYMVFLSILVVTPTVIANPKCGYNSCNAVKEGMINVHLVPHTHDDVGWLKTVDQYYYGSKDNIQIAGVQYILDAVIPELIKDKSKRFIYVEVAFFYRWWNQQTDIMRHQVKALVNNGQLEFILGGWCMNDEASTHYNAIIDQHTLGFEFLRQNFGECGRPRVAWQIDPFGHSREQASLFAQMGFDGLFFGRLDYQDKIQREKNKSMEMLWKGSPKNLGKMADLFTGVLYNGYGPPRGFCFDLLCQDQPIMDDDRMEDYNVDEKVNKFINATLRQAEVYATDHLIMTMGSDFNYQSANTWYKNIDKLIHHVNKQQNYSNVNLLYSTPSCYLYQLNKANRTWPTKEDDFFPYAHRPHSFWTGYFTSRPALKGYVRNTNNFLQTCKQLDALAQLEDTDNSTGSILVLKRAMGVAQHHDAVSGTEKQHVAYDYARRLAEGVYECQTVVNDALMKILSNGTAKPPNQIFCNLLNISRCHVTEQNKAFSMIVYNPLARPVSSWIRLPVVGKAYSVTGPKGQNIQAQVIPITMATKKIPERSGSLASNELIFKASAPSLGFSVYFIRKSNSIQKKFSQISRKMSLKKNTNVVLKNQHVSLTFNGKTGKLTTMRNIDENIQIGIQQEYLFYTGHNGNNTKSDLQASGAYVFRPNKSKPSGFKPINLLKSYIRKGKLVQELHQRFSAWVTQVVRLYEGERHAEFEWTVGPIPIKDNIGKEVVSRFTSTLDTRGAFYTDANGREMLKRQRNYRATWNLNQTEPVAGNFYPVNSRMFIRDEEENIQLTVLTDRSQSGSSLMDGSLDLMVHRRLLHDDGLGVGEPLNETGSDHKGLIVRGKHFLYLGHLNTSAAFHRDMALKLYMAPSLSFSNTNMKWSVWKKKFPTNWSGMKRDLPANVHLLTLEQWGGPGVHPTFHQPYLLRLEHFYEKDEDNVLSQPANLSLTDLFVPFGIESVKELALGANVDVANFTRLHWEAEEPGYYQIDDEIIEDHFVMEDSSEIFVSLRPMQIRTFQVKLKT